MSVIKMLLLIGLLILVHELGHFLVAKMFKLKVSRFCIGLPFGPAIWEKKIGEVTYGIHWFLFGGYVSFPDDEKDCKLPDDSPELFKNAPIYQRACVLIAGVTANLITAYALVLLCCMVWHQLPVGEYNLYVDYIDKNAPVTTINSGLMANDRIVSINGRDVVYPNELSLVTSASKKYDNKISQEQYQNVLNKFLDLNPNLNAESALKKGDKISIPKDIIEGKVVVSEIDVFHLKSKKKYIELNEDQQKLRNEIKGVSTYSVKNDLLVKDVVTAVADSYSPIDIVIERNGKIIEIPTLTSGTEGKIGVMPKYEEKQAQIKSLADAFSATNKYISKNLVMMVWSLKLIIMGQVPMSQVQGIVAITKIGADVIENSLLKGFLLTAIISLNLAVLNLLPIPALDGGHLMFLLLEKIKGSPVNEKFIENCSSVFFFVLIALTIFIVGHDVWMLWLAKLIK